MINGRKDCRSGRACEPKTLQESIYCMVHHSDLSLPQIAEAIGKRPGYLQDAANPDCETVAFQVTALVPAMRAADNYMPLRYMAGQVGAVIVMLPNDGQGSDIRKGFMATAKELGDVAAEIDRALAADDHIDSDEFQRIDRQIAEHIEAAAQLRIAVARKAGQR